MPDLSRLSINQICVLPQWTLPQAIDGLKRHGVGAISVWREKLAEIGVADARKRLDDAGLAVSGLCFAGLVSSADRAEAAAALDDVRRALDEANGIGAPCVVFLSGGVDPRDKDLAATRARVLDGLSQLTAPARAAGVAIAIEPLHPMACATRSVLTTLKLANDWCDALGAEDAFGIALDAYVTWWDPELPAQIARAGNRIRAFHVSDWLVDTQDLRVDRGMPGDGVIDLPAIRRMVEAAGYTGHVEIEILSARNWWKLDPDEVVRTIVERYATAV
ncbi:MAG TPA: sugar phosphate isomerase/epimerase family protein [Xanthobacteraceae bacterium]|jgi:sugar phosphate isomerase/epimerase|nr:sugar phosphate isomerase/epimerase family protein [Xanthobacteraceae bacterium]